MNDPAESSNPIRHRRRNWFLRGMAAGNAPWLVAILGLLNCRQLHGVPYASGLTNRSGTVFFRLNESADGVHIISMNGTRTNSLGALRPGMNVFVLGNMQPYQIVVTTAAPAGFLAPIAPNRGTVSQIHADTRRTRFFSPRGIAINNNPASPFFGRIYVANATSGTITNTAFGPERTVGDGIYVLSPDFADILNQGDAALTGGLDFESGKDFSPHRLSVGEDDNLYVCDNSDTTGSLYVLHPDVSPGSGMEVFGGPAGGQLPLGPSHLHGSVAAAVVEGSLARSNLVAFFIDEDLQTDRFTNDRYMQNSLWQQNLYDTIPGVPWEPAFLIVAAPWVGFVSQIMDLSRASTGHFYVNTYRFPGNDWAGLYVHGPFGEPLWDSLTATRAYVGDGAALDLLQSTGGGAVSPDGEYVAVINLDDSAITVIPLINGIPDLANHVVIEGFDSGAVQGRDVAWDLAGNLYAISAGAQAIRAFSPGGSTTAITGSDGTFKLIRSATVSVAATAPLAYENGEPGAFSISRNGSTSGPLAVSFTMSGSAEPGVDYTLEFQSATIPAGATNVVISVVAIDDLLSEPLETVTLTLEPSPAYSLRTPVADTITVVDDDPAVINILAEDAKAYERLPEDTLSFRVERTGRIDLPLEIRYQTTSGTAVQNIDYMIPDGTSGSNRIQLAPGQTVATLIVEPIDDRDAEGEESVTITLFGDSDDYSPGLLDSATGFITDNDLLTNGTLFHDDFDSDTSNAWIIRFGANNGIYDADVRWAFDYGTLGLPSAPGSATGTTLGVLVQVNKTEATPGGSAAINLYPAGRTFAGNYALRFDLFLGFGFASTTEHALAGLNHSSELTNRITQSTDPNSTTRGGDGIYVAIAADGSNNRDWTAYAAIDPCGFPVSMTNRTAASLSSLLPSPPYAVAGSPGIGPFAPKVWTEVEFCQSNNVVTLKANNQLIYSFANTSQFTSGDIMLGHSDQFDSIGSGGLEGNLAIFDNVRVLSLDLPFISNIKSLPASGVQIDFISASGGAPADYVLQSASAPSPLDWNDEIEASITSTSITNEFRGIVASRGDSRFYRVQRRTSDQSGESR